jgi:type I restriction enzyme M protein
MAKLSLAKLERHLYAAADILRREGMDAATYKDFIFGMLFLKRSSDEFIPAQEALVHSKIHGGMSDKDAQARYGENPDYYADHIEQCPSSGTKRRAYARTEFFSV